jgi:hypothetical protein
MHTLRRFIAVGAAIILGACASAGGSAAASGSETSASRASRDRSTLTAENLGKFPGRNLYDVIRQERPHWLDTRGPSSLGGGVEDVVVYRDGARMGGSGYLRDINVDTVESVRHLNGPEAGSRFGLNHTNGAILVTSRRAE